MDKEVVYKSEVYMTPLKTDVLIDTDALRDIVAAEFRKAGYRPDGQRCSDYHRRVCKEGEFRCGAEKSVGFCRRFCCFGSRAGYGIPDCRKGAEPGSTVWTIIAG